METEAWVLKITSKLLLSEFFSRKNIILIDKWSLLFFNQRVHGPVSTQRGCDSALVLRVPWLEDCAWRQYEEREANSQLRHPIIFPVRAYTEEGGFWLSRAKINAWTQASHSSADLYSLNVPISQSHWCFLYYLIKAECGSLSTLLRSHKPSTVNMKPNFDPKKMSKGRTFFCLKNSGFITSCKWRALSNFQNWSKSCIIHPFTVPNYVGSTGGSFKATCRRTCCPRYVN